MRSKLLTLFVAVAVVVALASAFSVAASTHQAAAKKPAARPHGKKPRRAAATYQPLSVPDCINQIKILASREPFPMYSGEPMKLINGGLLWGDSTRVDAGAGCDALPLRIEKVDMNKEPKVPYDDLTHETYQFPLDFQIAGILGRRTIYVPKRMYWASVGQSWRLNDHESVHKVLARFP